MLEVNETSNSFLVSFMYYLGALTLHSKSASEVELCIPNKVSEVEYVEQLQHIFNLKTNAISELQQAVTQMVGGDIGALCGFIGTYILNLQNHNDVIHSMECTLKSVFILAVTIARGPTMAFSEYNLTESQADAVFLVSSNPSHAGVHVEFKNTTIAQLQGHGKQSWEDQNKF